MPSFPDDGSGWITTGVPGLMDMNNFPDNGLSQSAMGTQSPAGYLQKNGAACQQLSDPDISPLGRHPGFRRAVRSRSRGIDKEGSMVDDRVARCDGKTVGEDAAQFQGSGERGLDDESCSGRSRRGGGVFRRQARPEICRFAGAQCGLYRPGSAPGGDPAGGPPAQDGGRGVPGQRRTSRPRARPRQGPATWSCSR